MKLTRTVSSIASLMHDWMGPQSVDGLLLAQVQTHAAVAHQLHDPFPFGTTIAHDI